MTKSRVLRGAIAALAATGLVTGAIMAPAKAATRTTVVLVDSNTFGSLNPATPDTNLVLNNNVAYLTSMGFYYYNDVPEIVRNTKFGTMKIISKSPYKVRYTVNKGKVWSDGTPIDGVDLLLSHVVSSSKYSIAAKLGDPINDDSSAFYSGGYGGAYDENVVGEPVLDSGRMSVTVTYSNPIPDWEIAGPSPFPVHSLMELAAGEKKLGSVSHNLVMKNKFLTAFLTKDSATLKKLGKIWSEDYNVTEVNSKTNPLLLVCNGAYQVTGAVDGKSVTMELNPRYNSGPATSGITKIVYNTVSDSTAAIQALANKEVDVYGGQPTADGLALMRKIPGTTLDERSIGSYEHIEVRSNNGPTTKDNYTGVFADGKTDASKAQAKALRQALLMAFPREEIVAKVWKPLGASAAVMNSLNYFNPEPGYAKMVAANGSSLYTAGTQEERTAKALAIVQKYFPTTTAAKPTVKIKVLFGSPSNTRRAAEAAIMKAGLAKAGFDLDITPTSGWSTKLNNNDHDFQFYAWAKSALTQSLNSANYNNSPSMHTGYNNPDVNEAVTALQKTTLTGTKLFDALLTVEKNVLDDAISLPITQWPSATAWVSTLQGVKPGILTPEVIWNFWEWHF